MPDPRENETRQAFISRCMRDSESRRDFPREDQRSAFCQSQWNRRHNMKIASILLSNVATRVEMFRGKKHLVVPVVALVEGVLNRLFYSGEEITRHPQSWNGIPVVIQHPVEAGVEVSANTPAMLEQFEVGQLFNMDSIGTDKLQGEAWIDIAKAEEIRPEILQEVHDNLEVSTGLFADSDNKPGTFNGVDFIGTLSGYKPDHLALLPGGEGACNWQDGCGIRVNMAEERGGDKIMGKYRKIVVENLQLSEEFFKTAGIEGDKITSLFTSQLESFLSNFKANELGHEDIRMQLQRMADAMDTPASDSQPVLHFVHEVFDNFVVIRQTSASGTKLFKVAFDISDDNVVLSDNRVEVREQTDFVPASVGLGRQTTYNEVNSKKEGSTMADKCCKEQIDALISNKATHFAEEDRVWLDKLPKEQIDKLSPIVAEEKQLTPEETLAQAQKVVDDNAAATAATAAAADGEEQKPATMEQYIEKAPGDIGEMLAAGVAMHKEKKAGLVKALLANSRNKFTKEQLEAKGVTELQTLAELANVPVDYSLNSPEVKTNEDDEDVIPDTPHINWKKAAGMKE